ncbi:MAG: hypothetical protein KC454_01590 [Flavobacteriales bacterium]|nr:hypothetical protein [Flavobacteriales bacterium]
MSQKIHQLIGSIRENFSRISNELVGEQSRNEAFQKEIETLKSQIEIQNEKLNALTVELELTKNEVTEEFITRSEGTMISEDQIDELVKEIDYCIGQLKE